MKTEERLGTSKQDGTLDELITKCNLMQSLGATHYQIYLDCDRSFGSTRIEWIKRYTEKEIKDMQIKELEDKLNILKGQ